MWLGRNCLAHTTVFHGYIYELRIYDGALSPVQITKNREYGSTIVSFNKVVPAHAFQPQLSADQQRLKLRIPNPRSGFRLETSTFLGPGAAWLPVTSPTRIEPDETVSAELAPASNTFYRLHLVP